MKQEKPRFPSNESAQKSALSRVTAQTQQRKASSKKFVTEERYLPADPDGDTDDHCRHSDTGHQSNTNGSTDQGAELPQNLLLAAPRLLTPERAS